MSKKVCIYKGFVIAESSQKELKETTVDLYQVFTKDEWENGEGFRYFEMDLHTVQQCKEWIDCY